MTTKATLFSNRRWQWLWALLLTGGVNGVLFYAHYFGEATFPWDFLGGYHAHAFGWYAQGGVFSPPKWFPWSSMGFPAALAIQSGAWYAPLVVLDALSITYSIHVATIVQCLHVLLGAMGAYVLLRALNFGFGLALLGALCFELSAGFYSNQQHVDIIRAYAFFPWVLWGLLPTTLIAGKWRLVLVVLLFFQFLVAAYPGNIVTTGYASLMFVLINLASLETSAAKKRYVIKLFFLGGAALVLSCIKWVPYAMQINLMEVVHPKYNPFEPQHLLTLLFNYDVSFLTPNIDVTMRSVFVGAVVLVGVAFAGFKGVANQVGWAFFVMTLLLGCVFSIYSQLFLGLAELMGLRISRFPLSDWRPVLTIGLLLLGLTGWQSILMNTLPRRSVLFRVIWFELLLFIGVIVASQIGYSSSDLAEPIIFVQCVLLLIFLRRQMLAQHVIGSLLILAFANGIYYQVSQSRPWHQVWNELLERQYYDMNFTALKKIVIAQIQRRPERKLIVDDQGRYNENAKNSHYNNCWYTQTFCLMGNDNLKYSVPHQTLFAAMQDPFSGKRLIEFLTNPQQILVRKTGQAFDINKFTQSKDEIISLERGVTGSILSYGPEKVEYRINTTSHITVVENELWWPGWKLMVCSLNGVCNEDLSLEKTENFLRSWELHPGVWHVTVKFK